MRSVHVVLGTVGLAIIVGVIVSSLAADWLIVLAVVAVALVAGELTRLAIPHDRRLSAFGRLSPFADRRRQDQ
jgi:hypothetical protein